MTYIGQNLCLKILLNQVRVLYLKGVINCNITNSGLPLGQEKSGKVFKNDKSQEKMGGFEKKSGNLIKKKNQILSV